MSVTQNESQLVLTEVKFRHCSVSLFIWLSIANECVLWKNG